MFSFIGFTALVIISSYSFFVMLRNRQNKMPIGPSLTVMLLSALLAFIVCNYKHFGPAVPLKDAYWWFLFPILYLVSLSFAFLSSGANTKQTPRRRSVGATTMVIRKTNTEKKGR